MTQEVPKTPLAAYLKLHRLTQAEFRRLLEEITGFVWHPPTLSRVTTGKTRPGMLMRFAFAVATDFEITLADWDKGTLSGRQLHEIRPMRPSNVLQMPSAVDEASNT